VNVFQVFQSRFRDLDPVETEFEAGLRHCNVWWSTLDSRNKWAYA